jgi:hypothetical protein
MATNVYVDAFNLYYGCLKGTPYRWLDLGALCRRLLPKDRINRIRYFTATVSARPDNPDAPQRQQVYLRALETIPGLSIHHGHYLSHVTRMPLARPRRRGARTVEVVKTEEKGSDVNLATFLLLDAFKRGCEVAVVISNDRSRSLRENSASTSASSTRTRPPGAAALCGRPSSSSCAPQRSPPASSRPFSPTPEARSTSPPAGKGRLSPQRRRDPPKRASHPTAEAAGGIRK